MKKIFPNPDNIINPGINITVSNLYPLSYWWSCFKEFHHEGHEEHEGKDKKVLFCKI